MLPQCSSMLLSSHLRNPLRVTKIIRGFLPRQPPLLRTMVVVRPRQMNARGRTLQPSGHHLTTRRLPTRASTHHGSLQLPALLTPDFALKAGWHIRYSPVASLPCQRPRRMRVLHRYISTLWLPRGSPRYARGAGERQRLRWREGLRHGGSGCRKWRGGVVGGQRVV